SVELVRGKVLDLVKTAFRPEFLNRLDEILLFHRLGREHMGAIVDIQFIRLESLLKDRHIKLTLPPPPRDWLVNEGYDPACGARALKRVSQGAVQDGLADEILSRRIADGDQVLIDAGEDGVVLLPGVAPATDAAA